MKIINTRITDKISRLLKFHVLYSIFRWSLSAGNIFCTIF